MLYIYIYDPVNDDNIRNLNPVNGPLIYTEHSLEVGFEHASQR